MINQTEFLDKINSINLLHSELEEAKHEIIEKTHEIEIL